MGERQGAAMRGGSLIVGGEGKLAGWNIIHLLTMSCVGCCGLPAFILWIIWGGVITKNADDLPDRSECRAGEFWWTQVAAYIWISGWVLLSCCVGCPALVGFRSGANHKQKSQCGMILLITQMVFFVGASIYAIILWVFLGHSVGADPILALNDNSGSTYATCGAFFQNFNDDYHEFITLWKCTATFCFTMVLIWIIMLVYGFLSSREDKDGAEAEDLEKREAHKDGVHTDKDGVKNEQTEAFLTSSHSKR